MLKVLFYWPNNLEEIWVSKQEEVDKKSFSASAPFYLLSDWSHSIQHNDTQHNETQQNDTQNYDTQHSDTQHNDTQHNDTQHNNTQHNDTQHNDTQHYDTQHDGLICNNHHKRHSA